MSDELRTSGTNSAAREPYPSHVKGRRLRILGRPLGFEHWALLPLFLFLLLFVLYPTVELIRAAFSTVSTTEGGFSWKFSGLDNFYTMLGDEVFRAALLNTIIFVVGGVALQLVLGTLLAVLVERSRILSGLARNVLVWPAIITPVAISVTWWLILNSEFGLLNRLLEAVDLPRQAWLASTFWVLPALILVDVWHWTPVVFLLVLAGLANIDQTLYQAARVDGASEWRVFRSITLPLLAPTLVVAALVRTVLGFKVFDEIFLLTKGGPGTASEVVSSYVRKVFFEQVNLGYGAFLGLVIISVMLLLFAAFFGLRSVVFGGGRTS